MTGSGMSLRPAQGGCRQDEVLGVGVKDVILPGEMKEKLTVFGGLDGLLNQLVKRPFFVQR